MAVSKKNIIKNIANIREEEEKIETTQTKISKAVGNMSFKNYESQLIEDLELERQNRGHKVGGYGCLTVINHSRCGRRLHIANEIWQRLGCPRYVKLSLCQGDLLIQAGTENDVAVSFQRTMDFEEAVKNYKSKIVLYVAKTVERLSEEWGLAISDGCCFTGGRFSEGIINGKTTIAITFTDDTDDEELPEEQTESESENTEDDGEKSINSGYSEAE